MPNNCENTLTITGPQEDLAAFRQAARKDDKPLEMENFIPMPDDVRNGDGSPSRKWALDNWGTKWGAYECEDVEVTDSILEYFFCTAWSPFNHNAMKTMSARFPSLNFLLEYEEPGIAFKGQTEAEAGCIKDQWSRDMTPEDSNFLE